MSPEEFIDYAARLAVQPTAIAPQVRTITSRAYYGYFHLAAEFIKKLTGISKSKHDAHIWLMASRFPDACEAGKVLAMLNGNRIKADDRLGDATVELLAFGRMNVEYARDVQRLLQKCETVAPQEIIARR
jgi:hypothetical protein